MMNSSFADDPSPTPDDLNFAIREGLRNRGWRAKTWVSDHPWISDELASTVEDLFRGFFSEWYRRSGRKEVQWNEIARGLGGAANPNPFLEDPELGLCELFCLVAGIGEDGRAFDRAACEAGLSTDDRSEDDLRGLASSLRTVDRNLFEERVYPRDAGLLFERMFRQLPSDISAGKEGHRYRELTNLDMQQLAAESIYRNATPLISHRNRMSTAAELGPAVAPRGCKGWTSLINLKEGAAMLLELRRQQPSPSLSLGLLKLAREIRSACELFMSLEDGGAPSFAGEGVEAQDFFADVFFDLIQHASDVAVESDPACAWSRFGPDSAASLRMWFAIAAFEGRAECMPPGVATKWLRLVKQEMSSFRPLFGQSDELPLGWKERVDSFLSAESYRCEGNHGLERERTLFSDRRRVAESREDLTLLRPSERFARDREHFLSCADQVFQLEGLWEGMRQLLHAMRALRSPCVASDLRYWEEPGVAASHYPRQPEEPWRCIPVKLVARFHAFVGKEEAKDPELKMLRGQFAAYCLSGLRDKWNERERADAEASGRQRKNDDMVEPSPDWRYCRVRAAKTLAINPDGRGHRLLQTASEIDPDPNVREVANDAYQSLRRGVTLPEGMSPRRAVLGAFWWLRQAHLKALNIEIDRDGAQRTRIKELSRTKER